MSFFDSVMKGPGGDIRADTVGSRVKPPKYRPVKFDEDKAFEEAVSAARRAASTNAGGLDAATESAGRINSATADQMAAQMEQMFGGQFGSSRDAAVGATMSHLNGEVSESTQRQLARDTLRRGISELGRGAVSDTYAGFLGLTQEQMVSQGQQEFRSMFATFRQATPFVSGPQLAPLFTNSPGSFMQARNMQQLTKNEVNFRNEENRYQAQLTAAQYAAEPDPVAAAGAQQAQHFWGAITGYGASMGASFMGGGGGMGA